MVEWLLPQASTFAADIDFVIALIAVITGVWFFMTEGVFFWLLWRFRHKPGVRAMYVTGKEPHLKRWITWPHGLIILFDVVVIVAAVRVWYNVKQDMPDAEQTVRVIPQQWAWAFVHPGPDGKLDTEDDIKKVDELHLQVNTTYHFELESKDVLHSFSIPVFRLKQDAIPGRRIKGWFEPTKIGEFDIQCTEMCGIGHGLMPAKLVVETAQQHADWVASN